MVDICNSTEAQRIANHLGSVPNYSDQIEEQIARLRQKTIVNLPQLENLHDFLDVRRQMRQCCRVLGDSRTGKTVGCNSYRLRNKPTIEGGRPNVIPVVFVEPPPECTAKNLFTCILEGIRHHFTGGTIAQLRQRTFEALKQSKVEMLIIDEADRIRPTVFADLRDIHDRLNIGITIIGTDRLDAVVKKDEQVYNRFRFKYTFGRLGGDAFKQTVVIWEQQILQMPVACNLTHPDKLRILQSYTEGYIGILDMLLRGAAVQALKKGQSSIDTETLQRVAEQCPS